MSSHCVLHRFGSAIDESGTPQISRSCRLLLSSNSVDDIASSKTSRSRLMCGLGSIQCNEAFTATAVCRTNVGSGTSKKRGTLAFAVRVKIVCRTSAFAGLCIENPSSTAMPNAQMWTASIPQMRSTSASPPFWATDNLGIHSRILLSTMVQ